MNDGIKVSDLMHEMADMFATQHPGRNPDLLRMLREAAEDEREKKRAATLRRSSSSPRRSTPPTKKRRESAIPFWAARAEESD